MCIYRNGMKETKIETGSKEDWSREGRRNKGTEREGESGREKNGMRKGIAQYRADLNNAN